MGLSKNRKQKRKDILKQQKVENTTQKFDKGKKFDKSKQNVTDFEYTLEKLFTSQELTELKRILKTNDLTTMPLILGSVILEKFDLVKKLIKQGHDVNAKGNDNLTLLMWAVKNKNFEIIKLLISHNADVTSVDETGENVVFIALNSLEWTENCFLDLWNSVKKSYDINLEFSNKTGNRILHFAVRRQWRMLIESLIHDNVNINSCNNKGVTALTMAAARNDATLVSILLKSGANIFLEDIRGYTPICYTIVNIVRKNLPGPYETLDLLTQKFTKQNYEYYIQRRLSLIVSPPNTDANLCAVNVNKITAMIFRFITKKFHFGIEILLKLRVFDKIKLALEKHMDNVEYLNSLLSILSLILSWCPCCTEIKSSVNQCDLNNAFLLSGAADICLKILSVYCDSSHLKQLLPNVFLSLFLSCGNQSAVSRKWFKERLFIIEPFYQKFLDVCLVNFNIREDVNHLQFIKEQIKTFREIFDELKTELNQTSTSPKKSPVRNANNFQLPTQQSKKNAKRMRRKARALKARIDKIRSADVVERIRNNAKYTKKHSVVDSYSVDEILDRENFVEQNLEINENSLENDNHDEMENETSIELQPVALNKPEETENIFISNIFNSHDTDTSNPELFFYIDTNEEKNRKAEFAANLTNLQILLNDIIAKYKLLWDLDSRNGHPKFLGGQGDNVHPLLKGNREQQLEKLKPLLPYMEQQYLTKLTSNFNKILQKISNLYNSNNDSYKTLLEQLKSLLIDHEIRGIKLFQSDFHSHEDEPYEGIPPGDKYGVIGDHLQKPTYMELIENILPERFQRGANNLTPGEVLYLQEMATLTSSRSEMTLEERDRVKRRTEEEAYHLVKSVFHVCECDNAMNDSKRFEDDKEQDKKLKFYTILSNRDHKNVTKFEKQVNELSYPQDLPYYLRPKPLIIQKISRWDTTIRSLQSLLSQQPLAKGCGDDWSMLTLTSPKEMRSKYTIASGGNFGDIELGFDRKAQPLAVKRVRFRSGTFCRKLLNCVTGLMDVSHTNILRYVTCEKEPTHHGDIIISTSLCEFNLGEYLMCLKLHHMHTHSIHPSLILQLLLGLHFLHHHNEPIVHGNLKPSNILIDMQGRLRLAEFGIHGCLYHTIPPPKSSLIWFARETYESYDRCTLASDVQVAGMLVHFILTRGLHPFGGAADDILRNLVQGRTNLRVVGPEIDDLVSWMLVYDCCDRPNIQQVLKHIYFWPRSMKWRFLLACSGISDSGSPILDLPLSRFHSLLEILSRRNRITGDWISVVTQRFPNLALEFAEEEACDTPVGLLRFLRRCVQEEQQESLQEFFLKAFPALPLSLFRMIENTEWISHSVFKPFI